MIFLDIGSLFSRKSTKKIRRRKNTNNNPNRERYNVRVYSFTNFSQLKNIRNSSYVYDLHYISICLSLSLSMLMVRSKAQVNRTYADK